MQRIAAGLAAPLDDGRLAAAREPRRLGLPRRRRAGADGAVPRRGRGDVRRQARRPPRPEHGRRDVIRDDLTSIKRLRGFLQVTRLVRGEEELSRLLDEMAAAISRRARLPRGGRAHVPAGVGRLRGHRRARRRRTVRAALLHATNGWEHWSPMLDDRFLRGGAYFVPRGRAEACRPAVDQRDRGSQHAGTPTTSCSCRCATRSGQLVGILSVHDPGLGAGAAAGTSSTSSSAMADHAALAIQGAQESAAAARHRTALEQLLTVSSKLTETFSIDAILQAVCDGIHTALGFENVVHRPVRCRDRLLPQPRRPRLGTGRPGRDGADDARPSSTPLMRRALRDRGLPADRSRQRRAADRRPLRHLPLPACAATGRTRGSTTGCSCRCGRAAAR